MKKILISWIGLTDLKVPEQWKEIGLGPIGQAVTEWEFSNIVLICDFPEKKVNTYFKWLKSKTSTPIKIHKTTLSGPTAFGEIYESAVDVIQKNLEKNSNSELIFHLSPGTPAMAAVWIILSKTRFPAELIESSHKGGVKTASVPFDISAEFIPDLLSKPDKRLEQLSAGLPPDAPEFDEIVYRSRVMERVIYKSRRVASRSVPVLIEGESGTGKELLSRAIHKAGPRRDNPFVAVNCGAIPSELVESELFGHEKGAFTGADKLRKGYFEAAHRGTLFLDEIGELPLSVQVKLLRTLQEKEVVRLGSTVPISIDVRIIAATNRNLLKEIKANRFRADLFYRLAVAVLHLPPLKDRKGDISVLIGYLLKKVNKESREEPGFKSKKISASARNLLINHDWPGNVRELLNTIRRAAIWTDGDTIRSEDIREALIPIDSTQETGVLNKPLGEGLSLPEIIRNVASHYLERALDESRGNKTKAAELVGLPSYQTLTNWINKYEV